MRLPLVLLLLLASCTTPVYVYKTVDVPVTKPCHVVLPTPLPLPSTQPMPQGLTQDEQDSWILNKGYEDALVLKGELEATQKSAKGCE